ncbi:MAG: flagellar biosynthetic protein FliR [Burkholderiales bacterium]|nr:flagellar biosynthetic protein FliR [Burkholderiales bacterium]
MISISSAQLNALLVAFVWPLARILAFVMSAPVFSNRGLPLRMRVALAIMITLIVAPTLGPPPQIDPGSLNGLLILAQQIVIGLALGFAVRIVFVAVEMAGDLAGLQMGLGYATFFDPQSAGQIPVVGQFLGLVATLAFLAMDGHLQMVYLLSRSFSTLPLSAAPLEAPTYLMLAHWGTEIFRAGVLLAMPLLAALLIANLALGVLTRAAPQLNLFAVGFPLTLALGLIMLSLALPFFSPTLERLFEDGFATMLRITGR